MPKFNDPVESIVLRESIGARATVAPVSVLVNLVSVVLYIPFFLSQNIIFSQYVIWAGLITLLVAARGILSRRINLRLEECSDPELHSADQKLRLSSMANQLVMGMGIWMVQSPTPDSIVIPLFMTLLLVTWTIGVMANLFSDFRSYILSVPLMVGANASFWFTQGYMGFAIGLAILSSSLFGMLLVRRGSVIFRDSVLMRFEKDQLLETVQLERANTQRALLEAQVANESKAYFMSAASHDIKQPLHALALLTDTLLMSDPPASTVPILNRQRENISRMSEHFDALMDIGRFQGGHFGLKLSRFRLARFSTRIDMEIAPLCADRRLAWKLDMDDALISTDEELLLRAMRNLLINAVNYSAHGQVSCTAKLRAGFVEFTIADTGCGIAPEDQKAVFQEFVRLNNNELGSSGAGLGLSIVEKINQALGLDLQMWSERGTGTRFTFRLPVVFEA